MEYLEECFANACEAVQRAEAHMVAMRDAMRDAGEWLAKAFSQCPNGRVRRRLLERYKIGLRMAYYCRQVYERWEEVKNYPPELSKRRICQALVRNPRVKEFDPADLLRSQAFKTFLRTLFNKWEPEEINYLKFALGRDPQLEQSVVKAMKNTHYKVQEALGKKSLVVLAPCWPLTS